MSGAVVGVEPVALRRSACAQPLAFAGVAGWDSVCGWPADRHHLAAGGRHQRRLRRLLLLPGSPRTQDRIDGDATGSTRLRDLAAAGAGVVGDRRFADEAVRAPGRRSRRASQSDAGAGWPAVSVWTYLGDHLAGAAAPRMGAAGVATAGDALRPPANPGDDSQVSSLAAIRHEAPVGCAAGRVARSAAEKSGQNRLGGHRRWLCQAALLEAGLEALGRGGRGPLAQRRTCCATCRRS